MILTIYLEDHKIFPSMNEPQFIWVLLIGIVLFGYYKYSMMKLPRYTCANISAEYIPKRGISGPKHMHTLKVLIDIAYCFQRII